MGGGNSGGGSSAPSGGSNTVTQVQQIPAWEQGQIQANQDIANSLASNPYPQYMGQMIAGLTPAQMQSFGQASDAATSYMPGMSLANQYGANAAQSFQPGMTNAMNNTDQMANYGQQNYQTGTTQAAQAGQYAGAGAQYANQAGSAFLPFFNQANNINTGLATTGNQAYNQPISYADQAASAFTPYFQNAQGQVNNAETNYQPNMTSASNLTNNGSTTWGQASPTTQASYMNPYTMQALQPQIQQLQNQLGMQQRQVDSNATAEGAFGDARSGVSQSMNNYYANENLNSLMQQGMNTAYNTGMNAYNQGQGLQLQGGAQQANIGSLNQQLALNPANAMANLGTGISGNLVNAANSQGNLVNAQNQLGLNLSQQNTAMGNAASSNLAQAGSLYNNASQAMGGAAGTSSNIANQQNAFGLNAAQQQAALASTLQGDYQNASSNLSGLAGTAQQLGLNGASANNNVGAQQQSYNQSLLTNAYQQYQNAVNWPMQMLNLRLSSVSNQPYTIANQTTLPQANSTAQNLGALAAGGGLAANLAKLVGG